MRYPLKTQPIRLHTNKSLTWEDNHISLYVGDIVECHFLHGVPDPSSGASLPENADASDPLLAQTFSSVAVQQWLQPFSDFLQWLSAQTFFCSVAFLLRLLLFSRRPGSPHHIPWGDHWPRSAPRRRSEGRPLPTLWYHPTEVDFRWYPIEKISENFGVVSHHVVKRSHQPTW